MERSKKEMKLISSNLFESHKIPPLLFMLRSQQRKRRDSVDSLCHDPAPNVSLVIVLHKKDPMFRGPFSQREMSGIANVFLELCEFSPNKQGYISLTFLCYKDTTVTVYRCHIALVPRLLNECSHGHGEGHVSPKVLVVYACCDLKKEAALELDKHVSLSETGILFRPSTIGVVPPLESTKKWCIQHFPEPLQPLIDRLDTEIAHNLETSYEYFKNPKKATLLPDCSCMSDIRR